MKYPACTMKILLPVVLAASSVAAQQPQKFTVLHAARILDVAAGKTLSPGEVLIAGERIVEAGTHVTHPAGATVIDLGDTTLMPGLIDAHVHLFLHPGAEDLQTVEESVPQRTLMAAAQAKADVMAGFTAERDMGTEGANCADVAVRNAINSGLIPGPRMRVSCNAIDILGGHEDAIGYNPEQHVLSNADIANTADETRRGDARTAQRRRGLHQDLRDRPRLARRRHLHHALPVHRGRSLPPPSPKPTAPAPASASTAPASQPHRFAAEAGVASIDHAYFLSPATMKLMREKQIYAVPTFTIMEYFAPAPRARRRRNLQSRCSPSTPPSSKSR